MRILVGMDDSPHSRAALEFVKHMEWPSGSEVVVVSAAQPAYTMVDVGGASFLQAAVEGDEREHQELTARIERELRDAGLATTAKVTRGDPREVLIEAAREEQADLLVVGSHGRTGLSKLMMGSVASHVVTHAPCSVLVVKLPAKP